MKEHMKDQQGILQAVQEAREEWLYAQNYFENVTDPDLVDYAIYKVEAARRKYMYLLKLARIKGVENRRILKEANY